MLRCKECGADISHLRKPGPGRPPEYCGKDELGGWENPACRHSRDIKRKRKSDHGKIAAGTSPASRLPRGWMALPGPCYQPAENVTEIVGVDLQLRAADADVDVDLEPEQYDSEQQILDAAATSLLSEPEPAEPPIAEVVGTTTPWIENTLDDDLGLAA